MNESEKVGISVALWCIVLGVSLEVKFNFWAYMGVALGILIMWIWDEGGNDE